MIKKSQHGLMVILEKLELNKAAREVESENIDVATFKSKISFKKS
jgi:hypothetical protein